MLNSKTILVLIGDSIVAGLSCYANIWRTFFKTFHTLNYGIGGDRMQHVLWRAENATLPNSLKYVVIHCGTNNIDRDQPRDKANGVISIGLKLQEKCRGLKVIVTDLLPRDSEWSQRRKKVNLINYYLEKLCCDRFDDFYFMKQDDDWTDEDGKLDKKLYYANQLHLVEAGNRKFACPILKILSKLMQDEKLGNSSDERKAHYLFEFNSDVNHCKPVSHSKLIRPASYSKSVHPVRSSKPVRPINHCKSVVCPVYCKSVRPISHSKSVCPIIYSKPYGPVNHCKPVCAIGHGKSVSPVNHSKPVHPVSYSKPARPDSYSKPAHPVNHSKPVCSVYCKPVRPISHSNSACPSNYSKPIRPVNHCKPIRPISHCKPIRPVNHSKPVHPVSLSKPIRPVSCSEPVRPIRYLILISFISSFVVFLNQSVNKLNIFYLKILMNFHMTFLIFKKYFKYICIFDIFLFFEKVMEVIILIDYFIFITVRVFKYLLLTILIICENFFILFSILFMVRFAFTNIYINVTSNDNVNTILDEMLPVASMAGVRIDYWQERSMSIFDTPKEDTESLDYIFRNYITLTILFFWKHILQK